MDEDGNLTLFAYDADRNLLSVTDANGGITGYAYDTMDRRTSRTDPLAHAESSQYDGNGNLSQFTDRRGAVTVYQYDGLNRRTFADFGGRSDESSISYTWDGADRLTQAVDSTAGTITRTYDGLDDLLSEATPPGSVSYQYDLARRRTSMQVAGQPAISYTWDIANRLNGISQSTMPNATSVGFAYDAANRRTSLTLPNGIVLSYAYDNDSRVAAMSWMAALNQVGDLEYIYDNDGHVTGKSGSFATTGIPSAVSGNTFNLANEMTTFNGAPLSYDLNRNLTNDGANTYTWDARNHLSTLTGSGMLATSAGFIYGADMEEGGRPALDEKDISRLGVLIRLTVEFHNFLTSRGSSGEPRRDANSQIEALLWNLDLFTSMMHLYGILVGSTATTIDWNDIRIASLRERFVSIYDLFLAETNFER